MPPGEEEEAIKFYGAILGLTQVDKPPELAPRGGVWFRTEGLEVHLGIEEPEFTPARKAHPAFLVQEPGDPAGADRARGVPGDRRRAARGFHRCHVRDPFGNRLELVEPS